MKGDSIPKRERDSTGATGGIINASQLAKK